MNAALRGTAASATGEALLRLQFDALRAAYAREPFPGPAIRRDRIARLASIVRDHEGDFVAAIGRDFGHRSAHETRLAELFIVASEARLAMRRL
ncbi:MAG TPA: hypothetical protein PLM09_14395, partial [Casimicrobiaceae bacterium]|nr:hypothetical protein [Casimicrobiaceae bacterium]